MAGSSDRLVWLKGNLVVPIKPYFLMFELEERQFTLSREGDVLVVQPHQELTPDLCARIRRWKHHLLALLAYSPEIVQ